MSKNTNNSKRSNNKWLAFINIPIQMGAIIFAFAYGGKWLDGHYKMENGIFVKVLTILGVLIAFYNLNRQLKSINEPQD